MKTITKTLAVMFITAFFACTKSTNSVPASVTKDVILPSGGTEVVDANNLFGLKFFQASLNIRDKTKNQLVSPLSLSLALSMAYNAADGATKDSIQKALQLQGIDMDLLNAVNKTLVSQVPGVDNNVSVSIANALYYDNNIVTGIAPLESFTTLVQNDYLAQLQALDFRDPNSVNVINKWVSENTKGKIDKIIGEIDPYEEAFLLNAIYFNAAWQYQFDKNATTNKDFTLLNNAKVSVPFMNITATYNYAVTDRFSIISVPYGGGNFAMEILLPAAGTAPADLLNTLTATELKDAEGKMDSTSIQLALPRFKFSYSLDNTQKELTTLGMGLAFSDFANFSKLVSGIDLKISRVVHKTYIDVNEKGTEAAAVTAVGITTTSAGPHTPQKVSVDHPFLFLIREKSSGSLLFLGSVTDPSQS